MEKQRTERSLVKCGTKLLKQCVLWIVPLARVDRVENRIWWVKGRQLVSVCWIMFLSHYRHKLS